MLFTLTALGYPTSPDTDLSTSVAQTEEKLKQQLMQNMSLSFVT